MVTQCPNCGEWTALPADGGREHFPHVLCKRCGGALSVDLRYHVCRDCNRFYRVDYDVCPFCTVAGVSVLATLEAGELGSYTVEPKKRRARRGDEYYWQLYLDYGDKAVEAPDEASQASPLADSAPNGYERNGHDISHISTDHAGNNGAITGQNGFEATSPGQSERVDLAITETIPFALFVDGAQVNAKDGETATTKSAGNYNDFDYELIQDQSRLAEVAEMLARETMLGLDTETTGLDPHTAELLLLQVSTVDKVYIVDCRRVVPLALKAVLENPRIEKVAQNAKFEYEMLRQQSGITIANIYDSMLAERLLTAGISREISLKAIAEKHIGAILDKSVRESFYKLAGNGDAYLAPEQLHYAARDAFIMIPIRNRQSPGLKKEGLEQIAAIEFQCVAAVGDMELVGVRIDETRWRKIIADVAVQREAAAAELAELLLPASMQATMFGVSSINLNSNQQLVEALTRLGVEVPDTMEATLVKYDHPAIKKLLEYRTHEKTLSAFGENVLGLINPRTKRIHPDFNQYGADTGRFSCIAGETLISTTRGLKRIDSVQAGDSVQTSFGPKRVLAAWCNGVRPLVKVKLSDGRTLRLTPDHRVLTGNGDTWQSVSALSVGDEMFLSLAAVELDESQLAPPLDIDPGTSHVKHKATIPKSLSVMLCELAGLITADGTFAENHSHRVIRGKRGIRFTKARYDRVVIDFGWEDNELISKVQEQAMLLFGLPFVEHPHKTARRLQLASTQVSNALAKLGLAGTAHTKKVPEVILTSPALFQAAYLRGLFEGDGHISREGESIGLTSVNRGLLETVQCMLSFLGCHASIRQRHDKTGYSSAPRYALEIPGHENMTRFMAIVGFMSSRKNERAASFEQRLKGSVTPIKISGARLYKEAVSHGLIKPSRAAVKPFVPLYKDHRLRTATLDSLLNQWGNLPSLQSARLYRQRRLHSVRVVSIEPDGTEPVYDLTISDVSEFLANGLVVHNCTRPNVQQIPATSDFRKCFVAAEGYKLVTSDYSQCIARDSWVGTDEGWVKIQNHPNAISKGSAATLVLTTDRKYTLECTSDHRILTHRGWVEASALQEGDWVALGGSRVEEPEPFNERAWLTGFWVGDGSLNSAPGSVYFARGREEHAGELKSFIAGTLGEVPRSWGGAFGVTNQRAFADELRNLFNKKNLRLPLGRLTGLGSFLSGLFDADGNVDKNGVYLATKWQALARDVQVALLRYGIMSTIITCRGGENFVPGGAIYYRVMVSGKISLRNFASHVGFRLSTKARRLAETLSIKSDRDQGNYLPVPVEQVRAVGLPYRKYVFNHLHGRPYTRGKLAVIDAPAIEQYARYHWDRVRKVEPSGRDVEVFDVMDQPEQRFEANGFIVHNCELRILAELSGDPGFVTAFKSGGDLHTLTASQMFGVPVEEVQKPQRNAAKAINFGLAYGMGPGGLAPRLGVSLDEAKELISRYFKAYPLIQKWLDKAARDAVRNGYSATTLGRKRYYNIPDESLKNTNEDEYRKQIASVERQGKNSPIQGSNADMTKLALIYLRNTLKGWDARTVNTVHDEIVVEAREDQADEVKHLVEDAMVRAGEAILKDVPIVAEAAVADYWSK